MQKLELLEKAQDRLRNSLLENMEDGIDKMIAVLEEESAIKSEVYPFKGQYNDIEQEYSQGVLKYETKMLITNKIRIELLAIIDKLTLKDFSLETDFFTTAEKSLIKEIKLDPPIPNPIPPKPIPKIPSAANKVALGAIIIAALMLGYFVVVPKLLKNKEKKKWATETSKSNDQLMAQEKKLQDNFTQKPPKLTIADKDNPHQRPVTAKNSGILGKKVYTLSDVETYVNANAALVKFYPTIEKQIADARQQNTISSKNYQNLFASLEKHKDDMLKFRKRLLYLEKLKPKLLMNGDWRKNQSTIQGFIKYRNNVDEKSLKSIPNQVIAIDKLLDQLNIN